MNRKFFWVKIFGVIILCVKIFGVKMFWVKFFWVKLFLVNFRPWTAEMSKKATNCWNSKPVDRVKDPLMLIIEPPENVVSDAGPVNDLKKIQSATYNPNRVKVVKKE